MHCFQEGVEFRDLGLAVVDEQHRFGVHQRLQLQGRGEMPADVLVMTATPIPRTLALTAYGDMDVSRLVGLPPGRKPVDTRLVSAERLEEVTEHLRHAIANGGRAFWVCPLIAESEKTDLAAAEDRAATLTRTFGDVIGLIHGRMKPAERDAAMERFPRGAHTGAGRDDGDRSGRRRAGSHDHGGRACGAVRIGPTHQLRGRVGRGKDRATCLLVYQPPLGETAKARLKTLRETMDGFVIAEEDLRLRGAGELLGTRQSGMPDFRLADLTVHGELLAAARDDARLIVERDPELAGERGLALRVLLYLFERDEAVRYLRAG